RRPLLRPAAGPLLAALPDAAVRLLAAAPAPLLPGDPGPAAAADRIPPTRLLERERLPADRISRPVHRGPHRAALGHANRLGLVGLGHRGPLPPLDLCPRLHGRGGPRQRPASDSCPLSPARQRVRSCPGCARRCPRRGGDRLPPAGRRGGRRGGGVPAGGVGGAGVVWSALAGWWWRGARLAGRVAAGLDGLARSLGLLRCDSAQRNKGEPGA